MTARYDPILKTYNGLMQEVKARFAWIEFVAQGKSGLDSRLVHEFGHLQLRFICELIALGCLAAHGDIKETKSSKFQRAWSANDILQGLERLHPDFFPQPFQRTERTQLVDGRQVRAWHMAKCDLDCMTKSELLRLYQRCGDALHRGSLHANLSKPGAVRKSFPDIVQPAQRIANLLSQHRIDLVGGLKLVCVLQDPRGNVGTALAEPVDEPACLDGSV
jgi:hypothetical protein